MSREESLPDDRSTKARIRDAAIAVVAEVGLSNTTVRKVATHAGVSPGSVIHHFGSMDDLRRACDRHVAAFIREQKSAALTAGASVDMMAILQQVSGQSVVDLAGYLARVLTDDSPAVAELVDELVDDAETYLAEGVVAGTIQPSEHARERAVIVSMWSLGLLVLHGHVTRLLGVDPTGPNFATDPEAVDRYLRPSMAIFTSGLFTDVFADAVLASLDHSPERTTA